jgi:hypothetical protein
VVLVDGEPGYDRIAEYREVGGDAIGDISFEEFTRDFDG